MQFMLVLRTAICTNVFKNTETQKPHFTDWFLWQAFFDPKGSYEEFYCLKKYTNKFHCLLYKVFFIQNWDLLSMCSQTQFVQRFLIRF